MPRQTALSRARCATACAQTMAASPPLSGFVRLLCLTNDVSIGPSQDRSGRTSDMGEGQVREESGQK